MLQILLKAIPNGLSYIPFTHISRRTQPPQKTIIVQQYLSDRRNKEGISKIFVRSEINGKLISLANLVKFKEEGTAKELSRYNRQRAITISANISENYTLTEAIKFLEEVMADIAPENQITWKGKSEEVKETSNELFIIFSLDLLTSSIR